MEKLSQLRVNRDPRGNLREIVAQHMTLPEYVREVNTFDLMDRLATKTTDLFGLVTQTEFSPAGRPISESVNLFGQAGFTHHYDPITGEYLGTIMGVENGEE